MSSSPSSAEVADRDEVDGTLGERARLLKALESTECLGHFSEFYLDSSRLEVILDAHNTLELLDRGKCKSGDGRFRLLMGQLGVGKTELLKALVAMSNAKFPNVISVYEDFSEAIHRRRPTAIILDALRKQLPAELLARHPFPTVISVRDVVEYLNRVGKYMFLAIDEFQLVYTDEDRAKGVGLVEEMLAIGNGTDGRIHCIISGSSSETRRLCFDEFDVSMDDVQKHFPVFTGRSLNHTKFHAVWIQPIVHPVEFRSAVRLINKSTSDITDKELIRLYVLSGGNCRNLENLLRGSMLASKPKPRLRELSSKSVDPVIEKIRCDCRRRLLSARSAAGTVPLTLDQMYRCLDYVETRSLASARYSSQGAMTEDAFDHALLELADYGTIGLTTDKTSYRYTIPSDFIQQDGTLNFDVLTDDECFALAHPASYEKTSEDAMLKLLNSRKECWVDTDIVYVDASKDEIGPIVQLDVSVMESREPPSPVWESKPERELGRVCKEIAPSKDGRTRKQDRLGADGILFLQCGKPGDGPRVEIHRVQIKLANDRHGTLFHEKGFKDAVQSLVDNREELRRYVVSRDDFSVTKVQDYIVTTHSVSDELREFAKKHQIICYDFEFVKEVLCTRFVNCTIDWNDVRPMTPANSVIAAASGSSTPSLDDAAETH